MLAPARRYGADVILDEAHATNIHGPEGRGIAVRDGIGQHLAAAVIARLENQMNHWREDFSNTAAVARA